jgi:hypothetical protein
MTFLFPAVLLGLAALPALYFLLRLIPPPARRIAFPPLSLLRDLAAEARTPHRMPLWLLLLRIGAATLLIIGLAGPSLHPVPSLPGKGPVLLVIDNGWASAPDWTLRRDTALRLIAAARQSGRGVALLPTARDETDAAPSITGVMTADAAREMILALQPEPWPVDRAGAAVALRAAPASATKLYLADGITDGPGFDVFMHVLNSGPVFSDGLAAPLLTAAGLSADGGIIAHLAAGPAGGAVLAQTASGGVLARAALNAHGDAVIAVPLALGGQVSRLVLAGPPAAGGILLLDGSAHAALVGLAAGSANAEAPYLGALFFVRRALPPGSQVVTGDIATLINDQAKIIILADMPLNSDDTARLQTYLSNGGEIIRFAGPLTSGAPDDLTAGRLLAGDRRLGGALTWSAPQKPAPFDASSPFAGLAVEDGTTVSRQILADPTQLDPATIWARLSDGTPLVLGKPVGRGFIISILTTANADWSNLALSGLYPQMLARLVALAHGAPAKSGAMLRLASAMDAFGTLAPPARNAGISAAGLAAVMVSPKTPPGIYGDGAATVALNLGGHLPPVVAVNLPGAIPLNGAPPPRDFGTDLLAAALILLAVDLLISLRLRGLLRIRAVAPLLWLAVFIPPAKAQDAALATTLAYVITGDAATDQISADGLSYLSAIVSTHSSARLGGPAGVTPGIDSLNLFPLLYWPILPNAAAPSPAACAALTSYMQHGGLLVLDTQGGDAAAPGSGAGFAPGAGAALDRVTPCLDLPPLEKLTSANVLAHCFYIVQDFPGKFAGAPVYVATAPSRDADGVTPVLIGQNDWAAAWAHDASGTAEQTPIPDGELQRMVAERFGTNLIIYALTGSYKADQAGLPALLDKLGQ